MSNFIINFYYQLGKKLSKQGLIEDAIDCYLKVVELNPQCLDVYETIYNSILYLDNCDRIISDKLTRAYKLFRI